MEGVFMRAAWLAVVVVGTGLCACGALVGVPDRYLASVDASPDRGADADVGADAAGGADADRDADADATIGRPITEASDEAEIPPAATAADAPSNDATDGPVAATAADAPSNDATDGPLPEADAADSGPLPRDVEGAHLRLWLSADRGLVCSHLQTDAGSERRVTSWADQSRFGDDATLQHGQLGPLCDGGNQHQVGGVALPYFSAPKNGNVVDETLDVDLSFLANSDYSILVVERRWADYPNGSGNSEIFIGTSFPPSIEAQGAQGCATLASNIIVVMGYAYYNGVPALTLDQSCSGGPIVAVPGVSVPPPSPLTVDTVVFDHTVGHTLWSQGVTLTTPINPNPSTYAGYGAIGRGAFQTTVPASDQRFRGDIAEVVVYDTALVDSERKQVEAYLRAHWGF
jgi:hypothetical protein